MKLNIDPDWLRQKIEQEGDHDISACSPEIAARARELAIARGHRDLDHLITCTDGSKRPVWQFYIDDAAMERVAQTNGEH